MYVEEIIKNSEFYRKASDNFDKKELDILVKKLKDSLEIKIKNMEIDFK